MSQLKEDGTAGPAGGTATTMNNIAYLPSTLGAVTTAMHGLAKMQQDYDVSFSVDDKNKNVKFGNQLSISVPHQYWPEFSRRFGIEKEGKVSLKHLVKEAMEEDLTIYRKQLKTLIVQFFDNKQFNDIDKQVNLWRSVFGISKVYDVDVMVDAMSKEKSIQFLVTKLLAQYGNDRGSLELLTVALKEKQPLHSFKVFKEFDFLYGSKVLSTFRRVNLVYEALLDSSYQDHLAIQVDPDYPEVLDKLKENPTIKVVKNVIYPLGKFKTSLFDEIKDAIIEVEDDQIKAKERTRREEQEAESLKRKSINPIIKPNEPS
jgi:hypothetical protein